MRASTDRDQTRGRWSVPARLGLVLVAALLAACESDELGVVPVPQAQLAITVVLGDSTVAPALALYRPVLELYQLHLTVRHLSDSVALDSVISLGAGAPDTVVVEDGVALAATASGSPPREPLVFRATFDHQAGDSVFAVGPDTVQVVGGETANAVSLQAHYVGVGHDAAGVRMSTTDTSVFVDTTLVLSATAVDAAGQAIAGTPVIWSSSDAAVATVARADSGRVVVGGTSGTVQIVARLLTGFSDTATVHTVARRTTPIIPITPALAAGWFHTCGLTAAGAAYCWGYNLDGQDGHPPEFNDTDSTWTTYDTIPVAVTGGLSFASLSAGLMHTCGLTAVGAAYCWGNGAPTGTVGLFYSPVAVPGVLTFTSVTAGDYHTCGLAVGGAAYCWGGDGSGELGDGTTRDTSVPVAVAGGLTFALLSAGQAHTCGLTTAGAAYCWGNNYYGQLGDGTTTDRSTPVAVAGGYTFTSVSAGKDDSTCGLTAAGVAYCWGRNDFGELGDGTTTDRSTPVPVAGGIAFASVSAGQDRACGLNAAGEAYCWGANGFGELGDGTTTDRSTPVAVAGGLIFISLSAGGNHTCGLTAAGAAYCWGAGTSGPVAVPGGLMFGDSCSGCWDYGAGRRTEFSKLPR